ncbi:MAG TPA: hypothetical protein VHD36_07845 [Pirellulales bacterium]|nr:hypothetical protein [Pirellulales bacterium]
MTKLSGFLAALGVCLLLGVSRAADDYKVAAATQSVPEEVAADIAKLMTPESYKVTNGKRTTCELWLRSAVPVQADFAPSDTVLYPFEVGQLVGVVRFARKTTDFRNQEIAAGVYTLRYGLQPVDGNHVGTSETRDFLLLLPAGEDKDPAKLEMENLYKLSRDAAETTHPAIMPLRAVSPDLDKAPAMVHDEAAELWSVVVKGTTTTGNEDDQKESKLIQLVVVGHAAE